MATSTMDSLKGHYHHNQSRLSTGYGIGGLVYDEHSDWKFLARLCAQYITQLF